jgi:hypothetical protein
MKSSERRLEGSVVTEEAVTLIVKDDTSIALQFLNREDDICN